VDETTASQRVAAFLDSTTELEADADLDADLVRTDGIRTWNSDDLDEISTADDADPMWLRLRAAINTYHAPEQ
jgi:hypothetical protein